MSTQSVGNINNGGLVRERGDVERPTRLALTGFDEVVGELRQILAGLHHGSVTLIVQDGRVVQIDATRKLRLSGRRTGSS
jgi:hypothetical protein